MSPTARPRRAKGRRRQVLRPPPPSPPPPTNDADIGVCLLCLQVMTKEDSFRLTSRGLPSIVRASDIREDGFGSHIEGMTTVRLHTECRKKYTLPYTLDAIVEGRKEGESAPPQLRCESNYNPKKDCLYCAKFIDCEKLAKMPKDRRGKVHNLYHRVETMEMQTNLENSILQRKEDLGPVDRWTLEVESRVAGLGNDFCAAEVRYHKLCHLNFSRNNDLVDDTNPRGRPVGVDTEVDSMIENLCAVIDSGDECQYSMSRLEEIIRKNGDEPCSRRWLKAKLLAHYGEGITVAQGVGKDNVLNFSGFVGDFLQDVWYQKQNQAGEKDEKERAVELAAKLILEEIRKAFCPDYEYPSVNDLAEEAERATTPLLKLFLEKLITTKEVDKTKVIRKQHYIAQCVMLAIRPKSFISPLLLVLGACLHKEFGSKHLVQTLNTLGACHSYNEVKMFEYSLLHDAKRRSEEAAAGEAPPADGFVQWVFDNADWLTATLDGHNTFHCLGGAEITTPARAPPRINVPRLPLPSTAAEIAACGHFIPKEDYTVPEKNGLELVLVRSARAPSAAAAAAKERALALDALHLVGLWAGLPTTPSWSGFMKKAIVCDGVDSFTWSSVEPTPFIDQDPTDPETLHSSLVYAARECKRRKQQGCFVSYDNGLYPKAVQIVMSDESGELKRVVVRLGGFHSLMNFMGAVGDIMSGSGLEDLWAEIYARNSVAHMMTGKAYSRALRAHFLTQEAVGVLLLRSDPALDEDKTELCALHAAFLAGEKTPTDAAEAARTLWTSLEAAGESAAWRSDTGRLWWQYYQLVSLIRLFIRAERTGDWELHLATTTAMEPLYYAAGHHLYARSTRLYVQTMEDLDGDLATAARKGYFTVRRTSEYWAGVWTDMVVEQDIMCALKSQGGPTSRGLTESGLTQWVGTMPALHKVTTALEGYCGLKRVTSEQHVDLRESRVSRDQADRQRLVSWLEAHSPFDNSEGIRCLSTGVRGTKDVNCERAMILGAEAMEKFIGTNFMALKIPKKLRVVPLSQLAAPSKKKADPAVQINDLFMAMCCHGVSTAKFQEYLQYELCPAPPALFENGMMRTNAKAKLVPCLVEAARAAEARAAAAAAASSPVEEDSPEPVAAPGVDATRAAAVRGTDGEVTVVDGGYLLHVVPWPRPGGRSRGAHRATYGEVCTAYVKHVNSRKLRANGPVKVVFDGYVRWSTKCEEQRRRASKSGATIAPDIDVSADMLCTVQREQFLGNTQNKSLLIRLLSKYLEAAAVHVQQAEADADVLIVETALAEAAASRRVRVVATDTDILAVLIARAPDDVDITVVHPATKGTAAKMFDIATYRAALGDMVHCLLPLHALSGCDTTSAIYKKGKKAFWDLFDKDPTLRACARVFNEPEDVVGRNTLVASGERLYMELYREGTAARNLNELRYYTLQEYASNPKKVSGVNLRTVPFTSDAGVQHTLRSYLQVQQWLGVNLTPTDWGWTGNDLSLAPLPTARPYAPEDLLLSVSCGCKTGCKENSNCSCRKKNTHCTAACRNCRGAAVQGCTNTLEGGEGADNFG